MVDSLAGMLRTMIRVPNEQPSPDLTMQLSDTYLYACMRENVESPVLHLLQIFESGTVSCQLKRTNFISHYVTCVK